MPEFVQGKVKRVFVKAMNEEELARDKYDNKYKHSLQMDDGNWYAFGGSGNDAFYIRDVGLLGEGSEIFLTYEKNESNGNIYRNAKKGDINIINFVEGKKWEPNQQQAASGDGTAPAKAPYKPKDYTGVKIGHALNGALYYYGHVMNDNVIEKAKEIHSLSESLATFWKGQHPQMSDYDAGASVGHAVLNACKANIKNKKKKADPDMIVEELKAYALVILNLTGEVEDFIRKPPVSESAANTSNSAPNIPDKYADWDSDIPFNVEAA